MSRRSWSTAGATSGDDDPPTQRRRRPRSQTRARRTAVRPVSASASADADEARSAEAARRSARRGELCPSTAIARLREGEGDRTKGRAFPRIVPPTRRARVTRHARDNLARRRTHDAAAQVTTSGTRRRAPQARRTRPRRGRPCPARLRRSRTRGHQNERGADEPERRRSRASGSAAVRTGKKTRDRDRLHHRASGGVREAQEIDRRTCSPREDVGETPWTVRLRQEQGRSSRPHDEHASARDEGHRAFARPWRTAGHDTRVRPTGEVPLAGRDRSGAPMATVRVARGYRG